MAIIFFSALVEDLKATNQPLPVCLEVALLEERLYGRDLRLDDFILFLMGDFPAYHLTLKTSELFMIFSRVEGENDTFSLSL